MTDKYTPEWAQRYARVVAAERLPAGLFDDGAQEGAIAGWEASQKTSDLGYIKRAIKYGVLGVAKARPSSGGVGAYDALSRSTSLQGPGGPVLHDRPTPGDQYAQVDERLSAGPLHRAVASLGRTDREIVLQRFWEGCTNAEVEVESDRIPGRMLKRTSIEHAWIKRIRPRLRAALEVTGA